MISIESSGSFKNTERFLREAPKMNIRSLLESCGQQGVRALSAATKQDSGKTANSWYYEVKRIRGGWEIVFSNSNIQDGFPVAIMLQYGHGTGTGGYVPGRDYINPEIQPIFDKIEEEAWKAVTSA